MYEKKTLKGRLFSKQDLGDLVRQGGRKLITPRKIYLSDININDKILGRSPCQIFSQIPVTIIGKEVEFYETIQKLYDGSQVVSQQLYCEGKEVFNKKVVFAF